MVKRVKNCTSALQKLEANKKRYFWTTFFALALDN